MTPAEKRTLQLYLDAGFPPELAEAYAGEHLRFLRAMTAEARRQLEEQGRAELERMRAELAG